MVTPFRLVPRGLNLVTAGTVVLVFLWLLMVAAAFDLVWLPYSFRHVLLAVIAAGLVLALVGRCLSLSLPPDARAARAWGVLAALLDGCGVLTLATNLALSEARVSLPSMFVLVSVLFGLGGLGLGRAAFHFYLWSVAKYVGDRPLAVRALTVFWHAAGVAGVITLVTWGLSYRGMSRPVGQCWLLVITLAALHWVWRYLRLLSAVKAAVREYQPPVLDADDDPDREYRERYEQEVRDGIVTPDDD